MSKALNRDKKIEMLRRHEPAGPQPTEEPPQPAEADQASQEASKPLTAAETVQHTKMLKRTTEQLNDVSAGLEAFGEQLGQLAVMVRAGVNANRTFEQSHRRYSIAAGALTILMVVTAITLLYTTRQQMARSEKDGELAEGVQVGTLEAAPASAGLSEEVVAQMVAPIAEDGAANTSHLITFLPSTRPEELRQAAAVTETRTLTSPPSPEQALQDATQVWRLMESALHKAAQANAAAQARADRTEL